MGNSTQVYEYEVIVRPRNHGDFVQGFLVRSKQGELRYPPDFARFFREMAETQDKTLYTREDS